jgi:hypothetical protein
VAGTVAAEMMGSETTREVIGNAAAFEGVCGREFR